jgi:hypothetical protein
MSKDLAWADACGQPTHTNIKESGQQHPEEKFRCLIFACLLSGEITMHAWQI